MEPERTDTAELPVPGSGFSHPAQRCQRIPYGRGAPARLQHKKSKGFQVTKYFVVIAHARSGSTLLCRKLEQFAQAAVYLEIFHPRLEVIKRHLGEHAETICDRTPGTTDVEKRAFLATHPGEFIETLAAESPTPTLVFKIFPGHLKPPHLRQVIMNSAGVIMLHRNLLHSHISNKIAKEKKKWGGKIQAANL